MQLPLLKLQIGEPLCNLANSHVQLCEMERRCVCSRLAPLSPVFPRVEIHTFSHKRTVLGGAGAKAARALRTRQTRW
jgi:hypothetical protein